MANKIVCANCDYMDKERILCEYDLKPIKEPGKTVCQRHPRWPKLPSGKRTSRASRATSSKST